MISVSLRRVRSALEGLLVLGQVSKLSLLLSLSLSHFLSLTFENKNEHLHNCIAAFDRNHQLRMAEVAFAKSFLAKLDSQAIRIQADHVEDPKKLPGRPPVCLQASPVPLLYKDWVLMRQNQYILPRMPKPMSKPLNLAPGQERSLTVLIKSLRNPPLEVKLTAQPLDTSLLDIKAALSAQTRIPAEKTKLLFKKKPVADSKVLKDLVGDNEGSIEFSVMVIGGAAAIPPPEAPVSVSPSGAALLGTTEFWDDLQGFLSQRLKDDKQAQELSTLFRSSWEAKR